MKPLVEIRGLHTHFRTARGQTVRAVDGVSLAIARDTVTGLVGESGSGKSTLGKTLAGLLPSSAGEILYAGELLPRRHRPADFRRQARAIQMIFQDPYASLNPRMTVGEILCEPLRLQAGGPSREHRELAARWLERVGLAAGHLGRYPHEFSGGQRQRIGIARALILEPEFVVCDEPISALDVSVQAQIVNLLEELRASLGLTLLFIAHDLAMVRHVSQRIAVMYLGRLVEEGPAEALWCAPLHPYTQLLVASNPEPDPRAARERAHVPAAGEPPSPLDALPGCRFATRCPLATGRCHVEAPLLRPVAGDRMAACHLLR
ncbi:MAG: ABC transporter ATP-binding protein [Pseudomonadales bacterium]|nr:ABC transporter ATP-binding protein [Pseudomonadales bacterium]